MTPNPVPGCHFWGKKGGWHNKPHRRPKRNDPRGHFPIEHASLILCFLCMPCRCPSSMRFWLFAFLACFVSVPRACGASQASFPHAARQPYRHADYRFGPIRTPILNSLGMQCKGFLPFAYLIYAAAAWFSDFSLPPHATPSQSEPLPPPSPATCTS